MASTSSASSLLNYSDSDWIRQSFMLPKKAIAEEDAKRRFYTTAKWKYTATGLGEALVINPLPQFTRYADRKVKNLFGIGNGQGRFYSEVFDDNQQRVHLRFGVPEYNSLTGFFGSFYDANLSALVRKGRDKGLMWKLGYFTMSVLSLPVQLINTAAGLIRYWVGAPASKFAYLKPTMPLYWNAYQAMLNTLAANIGIALAPQMDRYDNLSAAQSAQNTSYIPTAQNDIVKRMLPQNWTSTGEGYAGVNIYAVSRRAQMYADRYYRKMGEVLDSASSTSDLNSKLKSIDEGTTKIDLTDGVSSSRTLQAYVEDYLNTNMGVEGAETANISTSSTSTSGTNFSTDSAGTTAATTGTKSGEQNTATNEAPEQAGSWWGGQSTTTADPDVGSGVRGVFEHLQAEAREGSAWITYRVENIGTISESVSTSVSESGLASAINSASSAKRKFQFNVAGGNIGDGAIANTIEGIVGAVGDFIQGGASAIGVGGLGVLIGNGLADLPKDWESTIVNLPKANFQIQLRSWSGDKYSRFQNLFVPLAGLLCGALPRSTGPSSYDRPFMCELFYQGRQQVRYGVIDSLEITRGVGNVGWTQNGEPLGIDVSFSVADLSSIMHMPIVQGLMSAASLNPLETIDNTLRYFFGDDTTYSDYLATLSSVSLADRTYKFETLSRRWKNAQLDFDSYFSVAHFATAAFNNIPGRFIQALSRQSNKN